MIKIHPQDNHVIVIESTVCELKVRRYLDRWEILDVKTAEPERNRGHAQSLLSFVEKLADKNRVYSLFAKINITNEAMEHVLSKSGYEPIHYSDDIITFNKELRRD